LQIRLRLQVRPTTQLLTLLQLWLSRLLVRTAQLLVRQLQAID
jgi:hypothetical protein